MSGAGDKQLRECPFCGGDVTMAYVGSSDWEVTCKTCPVETKFWISAPKFGYGEGENAEAVRRWNTRQPEEELRSIIVERMTDDLSKASRSAEAPTSEQATDVLLDDLRSVYGWLTGQQLTKSAKVVYEAWRILAWHKQAAEMSAQSHVEPHRSVSPGTATPEYADVNGNFAPSSIGEPFAYYDAAGMKFHRPDEITEEQRGRYTPLYCAPSATAPLKIAGLFCPKCGFLHIDAGEWATRPHRTHQCQSCKHEWRPADVPTVGVAATDGGNDAKE